MDSRFERAVRRARESAQELSLAFERTAEALGRSTGLAVAHAERHGASGVDLVLNERRAAARARAVATRAPVQQEPTSADVRNLVA